MASTSFLSQALLSCKLNLPKGETFCEVIARGGSGAVDNKGAKGCGEGVCTRIFNFVVRLSCNFGTRKISCRSSGDT